MFFFLKLSLPYKWEIKQTEKRNLKKNPKTQISLIGAFHRGMSIVNAKYISKVNSSDAYWSRYLSYCIATLLILSVSNYNVGKLKYNPSFKSREHN